MFFVRITVLGVRSEQMREGEVKIKSFDLNVFIGRTIILLLGIFCIYTWSQGLITDMQKDTPNFAGLLMFASGLVLSGIALMIGEIF